MDFKITDDFYTNLYEDTNYTNDLHDKITEEIQKISARLNKINGGIIYSPTYWSSSPFSMTTSIKVPVYSSKLSSEVKLFIERHIDLIENCDWSRIIKLAEEEIFETRFELFSVLSQTCSMHN